MELENSIIRLIKNQKRTFYEIIYSDCEGKMQTIEMDLESGGGTIIPFNQLPNKDKERVVNWIKNKKKFWESIEKDSKCQQENTKEVRK